VIVLPERSPTVHFQRSQLGINRRLSLWNAEGTSRGCRNVPGEIGDRT